MKDLNVIVVGAGIGGLQAALALATDGHSVTVLESVKEFLEVFHITCLNCRWLIHFRLVQGFVYLPTHLG